MEKADQSELVMSCPHVLKDLEATRFFCRTQDGIVAACNEMCDALETGDGLVFIHMSHFITGAFLPEIAFYLPINACLRRNQDGWLFEYFEDATEAEIGEFRLADPDHAGRHWVETTPAQLYILPDETPVTATLAEGTRVIPIWSSRVPVPADFSRVLVGTEKLTVLPFAKIQELARLSGVQILAIDFLVNDFDVGLLVSKEP